MGLAGLINKQTKQQDIENSLVEAIFDSIRVNNPPSQRTKQNIKPSKTMCLRQMYYILTGAPANAVTTTDPKLIMIQKVGTFIHSLIQEAMFQGSNQGIIFKEPRAVVALAAERGIPTRVAETTHSTDNPYECHCINDEWNLSFMFDGAILFKNRSILIEIKSEDHFKWMKRIAPDDQHIEQATYYSIGLDMDEVIFLYVDRNYMTIKAYRITITEEMKERAKEKMRTAKKHVDSKTLPEAVKCTACKYCDYTKACKSNLNPLAEIA